MEWIQQQLKKVIFEVFGAEATPEIVVAPANTGADYATNVALQLAKVAHKSPMQIAEDLRQALPMDGLIEEVSVAAPGFLNFKLKDNFFKKEAAGVLEKNISQGEYSGKTVVTEFSDPNPFKVLHVGHLYTSIIGDAISRLLELAGARVVRANFGGDVGLHVGKTIWAILQNNYSSGDITIEQIAKCYVEGTRAYDEDEAAKQAIIKLNKAIYAIAALGPEKSMERLELEMLAEDFELSTVEMADIAQLYWHGRELSYQYFDDFYSKIGVKFDKYYPESTVADKGLAEVRAHVGTTYEESDGAIVYRGEKVGLHTRVFINRDGVPTYEAKDVGLIFTKWADWHFDESVVITGNEQSDYMKVVLASVHEYAPELVDRTQHLTHGMVRLQGNVKMSSRKGNFLKAVDVLAMIKEELGGASDERVVLAAVKYAFLKYKMGGDIVFDPKESVAVNGNSGVYLLYAAVRAKKILQKIGNVKVDGEVATDTQEERKFEKALNKKMAQYFEVVNVAIRDKAPYKVCNYLYELAQEFSRFYENVKVAGNAREVELKETVNTYLRIMEQGLGLLGIEIPEEM